MDISNRTLAIFLVVAVVISLAGTLLSLNKLNQLSTTGFATSTGTAEVNVSSTASLVFDVNLIDFGSGSVNASSNNNCTLFANLSGTGFKSLGCAGFVSSMPGPFVIENDGNLPLNVTLMTDKNAASFIGGGSGSHPSPQFKYAVFENETGSCVNGLNPGAWTTVNTTSPGTSICNDLEWIQTNDTLSIGVLVLIPDDASSGQKTSTFTATGTNP